MDNESQLMISDCDLVWLFLLDLHDWITDVPKAGRTIYGTELADGLIIYHPSGMRHSGIGDISLKDEGLKDEVDAMMEADSEVIDEEYLESQRFVRLKLKDFKVDLPGIGKRGVGVDLSLHRVGIAVLAFRLSLVDVNLSPTDIVNLELLPRSRGSIKIQLPMELIREYSKLNKEVGRKLSDLPSDKRFLSLEASLDEVVWYYWSSIVNAIWGFKSEEEILDELRYGIFAAYPFVSIRRTIPEYETPSLILQNHPRLMYSILTQVLRWPVDIIKHEKVEEMLSKDISERTDVSIFMALESTLYINSESGWKALKMIAEKRGNPTEYEYMFETRQIITLLELLQVQRHILWLYDHLLSSRPIESMSPGELARRKTEITRAVDEYYNIKISAQRESWERIEYGKKIFRIPHLFDTVSGKLGLMEEGISSLHNIRMEALGLGLTILLSVVPLIFDFPALIIGLAAIVLFGVYLISGILWKTRRS